MREDTELLRRYVEFHSEADFTELVRRHLGFVYHAALRRTGGRADLAEEVSQCVFTTLASKAPALLEHPVLAGWLYTTTRHSSAAALRGERRRAARDAEALRMSTLEESPPEPEWQRVREELDGVMDQLSDRDREAILLRFFHHEPFSRIGATFALSEDAARKRVDRALERLGELLRKRGVTSTSAALATMLTGQAVLAAPAGLLQTVAGTALTQAAAGAALPTAGFFQFMSTKTTLGLAGVLGLAGLLIVPTVGIAVYESRQAGSAQAALLVAQREDAAAVERLRKLQQDVAVVDRRAAETQATLERVRASLAAQPPPAANPAPPANKGMDAAKADAQKFFATFAQSRPMLIEIGRAQLRRGWGNFYRFGNLTPGQIEEFESRTAEFWLENAAMTPTTMNPTVSMLPDDKLRQIFGEEGYRRFEEFGRVRPAYELTTQLAANAGYAATPLTDQQSDQVVQVITQHSPSYQNGGKLDLDGLDWNAILPQIQEALTPAQWQATQPALLSFQFRRSINRAHQQQVGAIEKSKP